MRERFLQRGFRGCTKERKAKGIMKKGRKPLSVATKVRRRRKAAFARILEKGQGHGKDRAGEGVP